MYTKQKKKKKKQGETLSFIIYLYYIIIFIIISWRVYAFIPHKFLFRNDANIAQYFYVHTYRVPEMYIDYFLRFCNMYFLKLAGFRVYVCVCLCVCVLLPRVFEQFAVIVLANSKCISYNTLYTQKCNIL